MKTTTKPEVLKVSDYALIHDIPTYALNYLACGEDESLAPDDIENIEEWEKDYYLAYLVEGQQVALHSAAPAFGSPCPCKILCPAPLHGRRPDMDKSGLPDD